MFKNILEKASKKMDRLDSEFKVHSEEISKDLAERTWLDDSTKEIDKEYLELRKEKEKSFPKPKLKDAYIFAGGLDALQLSAAILAAPVLACGVFPLFLIDALNSNQALKLGYGVLLFITLVVCAIILIIESIEDDLGYSDEKSFWLPILKTSINIPTGRHRMQLEYSRVYKVDLSSYNEAVRGINQELQQLHKVRKETAKKLRKYDRSYYYLAEEDRPMRRMTSIRRGQMKKFLVEMDREL